MTQPVSPFNRLFAQLTQGMSAARGQRVVNELGWQKDAQHTTEERAVWIPGPVGTEPQAFQLPDMTTPWRQASRFDVAIYGSSYDRFLTMHGLLVAWLDLLEGPPMGSVPSGDETPATIRGASDLNLLAFPYSGLAGLTLDFVRPLKRTLTFPGTPLASVNAIAATINALAAAVPLNYRARIVREDGEAFLELLLPTDPLGTEGSALSLTTLPATSANDVFSFPVDDGGVASGVGTPATEPYRPGYLIGEGTPGPRGMDLQSQGVGAVVPVTLYRPIVSIQFLAGVVLETPIEVLVTGGSEPDETVVATS